LIARSCYYSLLTVEPALAREVVTEFAVVFWVVCVLVEFPPKGRLPFRSVNELYWSG
jgi:hypothetical protein